LLLLCVAPPSEDFGAKIYAVAFVEWITKLHTSHSLARYVLYQALADFQNLTGLALPRLALDMP
jgi:hypothetical protein